MSLSPCPQSDNRASLDDSTKSKRSGSELLSEKFAPFDHRSTVVEPFDNETKRDAEFFGSAYMRVH